MDNSNIQFGTYIKTLRKAKKMSCQTLSEKTGYCRPYLSSIENGLANNPSVELLRTLSEALGCTLIGFLIKAGHVTELEVFGFIDQENVRQTNGSL